MNVLKDFPYRPRYYLTHPWKFIDECWTNLKNAWMRVTRGWSYMDLYNMDNYLTDVMIDMLRTLAREAHEYPGIEPFETPEKWTSWLWYIAGELEASKEEFYEGKNEFKEEYYKELDNWKIDFEKDENGKSKTVNAYYCTSVPKFLKELPAKLSSSSQVFCARITCSITSRTQPSPPFLSETYSAISFISSAASDGQQGNPTIFIIWKSGISSPI